MYESLKCFQEKLTTIDVLCQMYQKPCPLCELLKKYSEINWMNACGTAFHIPKNEIIDAAKLNHDETKELI